MLKYDDIEIMILYSRNFKGTWLPLPNGDGDDNPDNVSNAIWHDMKYHDIIWYDDIMLDVDDNVYDFNPRCLTAVARWGWWWRPTTAPAL